MRILRGFIFLYVIVSLFACARTAQSKVEDAEYFESVMKYDVALDKYNRAIQIEPENAELYYRKGRVLAKMAVPLLLEMSKEKSFDTEGRNLDNSSEINVSVDKAKIAEIEQKIRSCHQQAIMAYKKAIELNPELDQVFFPMAGSYYQLKEWDNAIIYYNRALKSNFENPDAYLLIADCYEKKGEQQKAMENYRLAAQYGSQKAKDKLK